MLVGYSRVSKNDMNLYRQLDALKEAGVDLRNVYQEKITGTTKERPQLLKMIEELQPGDCVIIAELTRLSRSTMDLFTIVKQIHEKGAEIKSLKEPWLDTTTPKGNCYLLYLLD